MAFVVAAVIALSLLALLALRSSNAAASPDYDVRETPWASQHDGAGTIDDVPMTPSALFPAGITYAEALTALYLASRGDGSLPPDTALVPPLPREVVVVEPLNGSMTGLRLSLLAPFGWTPDTRVVRHASLSIPGSLSDEEANEIVEALKTHPARLPDHVTVDVPTLVPCQIAHGSPERRPEC